MPAAASALSEAPCPASKAANEHHNTRHSLFCSGKPCCHQCPSTYTNGQKEAHLHVYARVAQKSHTALVPLLQRLVSAGTALLGMSAMHQGLRYAVCLHDWQAWCLVAAKTHAHTSLGAGSMYYLTSRCVMQMSSRWLHEVLLFTIYDSLSTNSTRLIVRLY